MTNLKSAFEGTECSKLCVGNILEVLRQCLHGASCVLFLTVSLLF